MGLLNVSCAGLIERLPCPAICVIGRHWTCPIRIDHIDVPQYWVELRWFGSTWGWRCLNGEERTAGTGLPDWRGWNVTASSRPITIRIGNHVRVMLDASEPPLTFARGLSIQAWLNEDELDSIPEAEAGDKGRVVQRGPAVRH